MKRRPGDRTVAGMSHRHAGTASVSTLERLGTWAAHHRRLVFGTWAVAVLVLGALAPFADRALSGAGWEAPGSESGQARRAIESDFPGHGTYALSVVVSARRGDIDDQPMRAALTRVAGVLRADHAVHGVLPPSEGVLISRDRRTAIVTGSRERHRRRWSRRQDGSRAGSAGCRGRGPG